MCANQCTETPAKEGKGATCYVRQDRYPTEKQASARATRRAHTSAPHPPSALHQTVSPKWPIDGASGQRPNVPRVQSPIRVVAGETEVTERSGQISGIEQGRSPLTANHLSEPLRAELDLILNGLRNIVSCGKPSVGRTPCTQVLAASGGRGSVRITRQPASKTKSPGHQGRSVRDRQISSPAGFLTGLLDVENVISAYFDRTVHLF